MKREPRTVRALDPRLHPVEQMRQPAAPGLQEGHPKLREALENTAADQRHRDQHVAEREGRDPAPDGPVVEVVDSDIERRSGARVESDRRIEFRQRPPQRIVELVVQGIGRHRIRMHRDTAEAVVDDAAPSLARRLFRVAQVERSGPDQTGFGSRQQSKSQRL